MKEIPISPEKGLEFIPGYKEEIGTKLLKEKLDNIQVDLSKINYFLFSIVIVLIVMVATLIIMVATLLIDSFHINSATYKEYSQKTEVLEILLKQNTENQEELQTFKE